MNQNWLEMIFPAALGLLVVTMGVLLLSLTGVLYQEPPTLAEMERGCGVVSPIVAADTVLALPPGADAAAVAAGDALFKGNCAQCHAVHDVVVGPALAGITKCRPEKWLLAWVKNSGKVVASGDEYALKIFDQYQQQQMPGFQLSDEESKAILLYISAQENRTIAVAAAD